MNLTEIPKLAQAVNRWLSYQMLCKREALLSEAYLGHPLVEFLANRHSGQLNAESNHPTLKSPGPGRPRQIDYVLFTKTKGAIEVAIECKWISELKYDKQRIVNDVLRLECIRVAERHVNRYFLVAGRRSDFRANFQTLQVNSGKSRIPFTAKLLSFSLKHPDRAVNIRTCPKPLRKYFGAFAASFKAGLPISIRTKLVGSRTNDDLCVYVWQISSVRNRRLFTPKKAWRSKD
jgi:hypothetical protein